MPGGRQPRDRGPHGARGRPIAAPRPILIHGSGGDHRVWVAVAARLAGAVTIDLPGHPEGEALRSVEELGAAVARAVTTVDPPRALVGHSLGGAVALWLAVHRPELVDGLVVLAGGARLPVPEAVMARVAADPAAERERLMAGFVADPGTAPARALRTALQACPDATLAADYAACRDVDLRGELGRVRAPAMVIAGGEDRLVPPWLGEELARGLPMARMVLVPEARHAPMADAPATVSLLLAAYLARLELTLEAR